MVVPILLALLGQGEIEPTETLTIAAGDTVLIKIPVKVPKKRTPAYAAMEEVRGPRGVTVIPWVEMSSTQPGSVMAIYGISVSARTKPSTQLLEAQLVVKNAAGKTIGRRVVEHELKLRRPAPTEESIAADKKQFLAHQPDAKQAYDKLRSLHDHILLSKFVRPPDRTRIPAGGEQDFRDFMHHRLRAQIARDRLRAAADVEDEKLALLAIQALGTLTRKPTGPAAKARALEGLTIEQSLVKTRATLDDLQIDEAEGFLTKIRKAGNLRKPELARALELLAAIRLARGSESAARGFYGQVLCVAPDYAPRLKRPAFKKAFADAKAQGSCRDPIVVTDVSVTRDQGPSGLIYRVKADFGPDAFGLVAGGEIQIWGSGGGMFSAEKVEATRTLDAGTFLIAEFADQGNMETYGGQLLIKVFLRDITGVGIASFGDPDPKPINIGVSDNVPSVDIPWWVWVVAGGVAVVGAATVTGVLLAGDGEPPPTGFGPIEVTF